MAVTVPGIMKVKVSLAHQGKPGRAATCIPLLKWPEWPDQVKREAVPVSPALNSNTLPLGFWGSSTGKQAAPRLYQK